MRGQSGAQCRHREMGLSRCSCRRGSRAGRGGDASTPAIASKSAGSCPPDPAHRQMLTCSSPMGQPIDLRAAAPSVSKRRGSDPPPPLAAKGATTRSFVGPSSLGRRRAQISRRNGLLPFVRNSHHGALGTASAIDASASCFDMGGCRGAHRSTVSGLGLRSISAFQGLLPVVALGLWLPSRAGRGIRTHGNIGNPAWLRAQN